MRLIGETQILFRIQGCNTHCPHQALHPFTVHQMPLISQPATDATTAIKRTLQMTAINQRHDLKICIRDWICHVIKGRSRDIKQLTLAADLELRMIAIYHFLPLGPRICKSPHSKKSFSILSLQIFACSCSIVLSTASNFFGRLYQTHRQHHPAVATPRSVTWLA